MKPEPEDPKQVQEALVRMLRGMADQIERIPQAALTDDAPDNFEMLLLRMGMRDGLRALSGATERVAETVDGYLPPEYQQP